MKLGLTMKRTKTIIRENISAALSNPDSPLLEGIARTVRGEDVMVEDAFARLRAAVHTLRRSRIKIIVAHDQRGRRGSRILGPAGIGKRSEWIVR